MIVRERALIILVIFATTALMLPFALSTCGSTGGVFCGLSGHATTNADCTPHEDIHFGLLAQFKRCAPEKGVFASLLLASILVVMMALVTRTEPRDHRLQQLLIATAAYTFPHRTMNPFDHLRIAFARGILSARRTAHVFFA